ncbi:MAG: hypothetical protein JWM11_6470 [Planctomycetaceae bacterium]|nr:hypothetical protein [Planctomycetaceae bacterium]
MLCLCTVSLRFEDRRCAHFSVRQPGHSYSAEPHDCPDSVSTIDTIATNGNSAIIEIIGVTEPTGFGYAVFDDCIECSDCSEKAGCNDGASSFLIANLIKMLHF